MSNSLKVSPTAPKAQEITNPKRILAISHESSADLLGALITDLTGTSPSTSSSSSSQESQTLAGVTHLLPLSTRYYSASVPIWLDLVSDPDGWAASFLSEEAKEVLGVLGGVLVVFPLNSSSSTSTAGNGDGDVGTQEQQQQQQQQQLLHKETVKSAGKVIRDGLRGWEFEGVGLAVGVGPGPGPGPVGDEVLDDWEDLCAGFGMEFVYIEGVGTGKPGTEKGKRNEYGEKVGVERVREALESNDWDGGKLEGEEEEEEEDGDNDDDYEGFDIGPGKEEDMEALKKAIFGGNNDNDNDEKEEEEREINDEDVQNLGRMMQKLQAVRDMSAGLPDGERKRMAKRAVAEVMKEL